MQWMKIAQKNTKKSGGEAKTQLRPGKLLIGNRRDAVTERYNDTDALPSRLLLMMIMLTSS